MIETILNHEHLHEWTAILIAFVAISLSLIEGFSNRRHNRLSVKPDFSLTRSPVTDKKYCAGLSLQNTGLGPAHIIELSCTFGSRVYNLLDDEDALLLTNNLINVCPGLRSRTHTLSKYECIKESEKVQLIEFSGEKLDQYSSQISKFNANSKLIIKFKSFHKQSFARVL